MGPLSEQAEGQRYDELTWFIAVGICFISEAKLCELENTGEESTNTVLSWHKLICERALVWWTVRGCIPAIWHFLTRWRRELETQERHV